ncbi:hypothetical protein E2M63_11670 [Salmonella enterica subsp. enterica]|nr:hypothetical protein [Salmonella enterica]ECD6159296.1 hypothetical protein [Salmonella enterica subsp. enterica]EHP5884962.1 hypothetical protein [Salmonella enterica]EJR9117858.1 hypothetical protein [Salmonella enterica]
MSEENKEPKKQKNGVYSRGYQEAITTNISTVMAAPEGEPPLLSQSAPRSIVSKTHREGKTPAQYLTRFLRLVNPSRSEDDLPDCHRRHTKMQK